MKTYVRYQDDGPNGPCGQSCSTTNPFDQLHIFECMNDANKWMRSVELLKTRKNPRVTMVWYDDNELFCPLVVKHPYGQNKPK